DIKVKWVGLRDSWLTAWPNPRPLDVMVALEDDVVVSPLYFLWLLKVLRDYGLQASSRHDAGLGVSLSPIRLDEITYPFRKWMPHEQLPSWCPVYLHAVPSSWGAVYFGDKWQQ